MTDPEPFLLVVKANGRVILPVALREEMGLAAGDRLVVLVLEKGKAELITTKHAVASTFGLFAEEVGSAALLEETLE